MRAVAELTEAQARQDKDRLDPKSLALYGLAKAIPGLLMLVSVPVWIRLYGTASYGAFAVIWGTVLFSASLGTGWLRQSILKFAGSPRNRMSNVSSHWIALSVLVSAVAPVAVVLTLHNVQPTEGLGALLGSSVAFSVVNSVYYLALTVAQRDQRAGPFSLAEGLRAAGSLAASILLPFLLNDYSGTTLILSNAAGTLLACSVLAPRSGSRGGRIRRSSLMSRGSWRRRRPNKSNKRLSLVPTARRRRGDRSEISEEVSRAFWAFGWPMGLWQAVAAATLYLDRFLITLLLGADAAGSYAAVADLLVRGFTILAYPIIVAGHPAIMRMWNTGRLREAAEISQRWTRRLAILLFMGALLGVLACLLLGRLLLGVDVDNSPTLWFLAFGAGCWQLSLMTHKGLEMLGRPRLMLLVLSSFVVIAIPANLFLIPVYGTTVPAALFFFSSASYCTTTYFISRRLIRLHFLRKVS